MNSSPIKRYLDAAGKSQAEFAAELGVRDATISDWVTGKKTPNVRSIHRIAIVTRGAIPVSAWFDLLEDAA